MIIRNCSRILGSYSPCRILTIMSNRGPPTCGVPIGEQCSSTGVPDDHEQSGTVLAGRTRLASTNAAEAVTESYPLSSSTRQSATTGITTKRNR